jgi:uncharacterized protein YecE (DUF72 family)
VTERQRGNPQRGQLSGSEEIPSGGQHDLFGGPPLDAEPVRAVVPSAEVLELARRLPKNLHFGTSSWSFPGWVGIVYAQLYGVPQLARHGLAAYARHPLLNAVNVDSTFYKVPTTEQLVGYAKAVPEGFRFMVKAYAGLTAEPEGSMALRHMTEPVFLDAGFAARHVVKPLVDHLGAKLGAILFQFSPLGPRYTRAPNAFVGRLGEFLSALPVGPTYGIELRDPEILGSQYEGVLRETGAVHCSNVHARMPPVDRQVSSAAQGPLLIRWMLRAGDDYESARARYAPFDRLREPDKLNRNRIAAMITDGLSAGRDVQMVAANKAEGSAPLTLLELAKTIVTN